MYFETTLLLCLFFLDIAGGVSDSVSGLVLESLSKDDFR